MSHYAPWLRRSSEYGSDRLEIVPSLENAAELYRAQGLYAEAEPLYKRALAIRDRMLGPNHPEVAKSLNRLGSLFYAQGRYPEAEPIYKRALAIREAALAQSPGDVADTLNNLAVVYRAQRRLAEAEALLKRALSIAEGARGANDPRIGTFLNSLAAVYESQGRYADAELLYTRALALLEASLGYEHVDVVPAINNVAALYEIEGQYAKAGALHRRGLAILEQQLGPDHPSVATSLNNLAVLQFVQKDWIGAASYWQKSTDVLIRRAKRSATGSSLAASGSDETKRMNFQFWGLIKATYRQSRTAAAQFSNKMFETAQWVSKADAARSVAQMAVRGASGNDRLARIVRERQDLAVEWHSKDRALIGARSAPPDRRNPAAEAATADRLVAIDERIRQIDETLALEFPDFAALVDPKPLMVAEVQTLLRPDETLILFVDTPEAKPTPEETFIWAVTKTSARWVSSTLGTEELTKRVAALRCGLDSSAWIDATRWPEGSADERRQRQDQFARRARCMELTGADVSSTAALPFDLSKAHELYEALFGGIGDLLANADGSGKHLIIVPSGPLTVLPFHLLTTEDNAHGYAGAGWVVKRHATTVLPSVASLKALRKNVRPNKARAPFTGFGNPLLTGRSGTDKRAFANQSCPEQEPSSATAQFEPRAIADGPSSLGPNGRGAVEKIRRQAPLPETADELCTVARLLGAAKDEVYLGARATEGMIKKLNNARALSEARIVHFATHGLVADETEALANSLAEPALLLTPPATATDLDDGLLTASEIAELKLDADWVVLSACNTAAGGDRGNAEALSGLARAFFYAGARALLVSHWSVDSHAAVLLTTGAFAEIQRDPTIGRAEALRRSMLAAMVDASRPASWGPAAHPAVWAPFVVVGEGAP